MPPEPERLIWCDWLKRHGIDPNQVLCDYIERRVDRCQLAYATFQHVKVPVPPVVRLTVDSEPWEIEEIEIRTELRKVEVVFQLEAPPLPWPEMPPRGGPGA